MEFEKIKAIIEDILNIDDPDKVTMDSSFAEDLGANSLDVIEMVMAIEEEFGISIPDDAAEKIVTVADAVEQIKSAL